MGLGKYHELVFIRRFVYYRGDKATRIETLALILIEKSVFRLFCLMNEV